MTVHATNFARVDGALTRVNGVIKAGINIRLVLK
jgi:hypothetical protein